MRMRLQKEPFEQIKAGTKTVELRLFDEKRKLLRVGDVIEFTNIEDGERVQARVSGLHIYGSFEWLFKDIPISKCGLADEKAMDAFYSKEEQAEYGVVGIELEVLPPGQWEEIKDRAIYFLTIRHARAGWPREEIEDIEERAFSSMEEAENWLKDNGFFLGRKYFHRYVGDSQEWCHEGEFHWECLDVEIRPFRLDDDRWSRYRSFHALPPTDSEERKAAVDRRSEARADAVSLLMENLGFSEDKALDIIDVTNEYQRGWVKDILKKRRKGE